MSLLFSYIRVSPRIHPTGDLPTLVTKCIHSFSLICSYNLFWPSKYTHTTQTNWEDLKKGDERVSIVKNVVPFGYFCDIGIGKDCLLHLKEYDKFLAKSRKGGGAAVATKLRVGDQVFPHNPPNALLTPSKRLLIPTNTQIHPLSAMLL